MGAGDGCKVGFHDGFTVGAAVGKGEGEKDGDGVGRTDGGVVGDAVGCKVIALYVDIVIRLNSSALPVYPFLVASIAKVCINCCPSCTIISSIVKALYFVSTYVDNTAFPFPVSSDIVRFPIIAKFVLNKVANASRKDSCNTREVENKPFSEAMGRFESDNVNETIVISS